MNILHKVSPLLGLATLAALGLSVRSAQADTVVAVDFPNGSQTNGLAVNDNGDMVGIFRDASGATKGYRRLANGTFSAPIVAPGDNQGSTYAYGINSAGTIAGEYLNKDANGTQTNHGFLLKGSTFTTFDIGGPVSTGIFAINNAGDFIGSYGSYVQTDEGYINVKGAVTKFDGPTGNTGTYPVGINDSDQVAGKYRDSSGVTHGFLRDPKSGTITTIDVPGAAQTGVNGINDAGTLVGYYVDNNGNYHGFIDKGGVFTTYDVPGTTSAAIVGINNEGVTVGNTTDNNGNFHGFLDTPAPGHTHLLWTSTSGQASVWTLAPDGSHTLSPTFGPFPHWSAKALTAAPDTTQHLLWTNSNGAASLWNLAQNGSYTTSPTYGPYPGWSATSLSTSPTTGQSRLLWTNTSGAASVWSIAPGGSYTLSPTFGPFPGWSAKLVASGASTTDLVWVNGSAQASGWKFAADGSHVVSPTYGPYSNWYPTALSVGPDEGVHLLWDNVNGQIGLWSGDFGTGLFSEPSYGPFSSWSGTGLATGLDNVTHVLWNHAPDGQASLWATTGSGYTHAEYGPFSGWSAIGISAGP